MKNASETMLDAENINGGDMRVHKASSLSIGANIIFFNGAGKACKFVSNLRFRVSKQVLHLAAPSSCPLSPFIVLPLIFNTVYGILSKILDRQTKERDLSYEMVFRTDKLVPHG